MTLSRMLQRHSIIPLNALLLAMFVGASAVPGSAQVIMASTDATGASALLAFSANGRYVVYESLEAGGMTLFLKDLLQGAVVPLGLKPLVAGNASVSDDGRFVVLAPRRQFDRTTGEWTEVPHARLDPPFQNPSPQTWESVVSATTDASGRFLAFVSDQRPWPGDCCSSAAYRGIFVRDRDTGVTCGFAIPQTDFSNSQPLFEAGTARGGTRLRVSDGGETVIFHASLANPVPGDTDPMPGLFALSCPSGQVSRSGGSEVYEAGLGVSSNVRFQAYFTTAGSCSAVVRDTVTGTATTLALGDGGMSCVGAPSVSSDGRYLTYVRQSPDGHQGVFWSDLRASITRRVDENPLIGPSNGEPVTSVTMSADGSKVVFTSTASNLVAGDADTCGITPGPCPDVFVRNMLDDDGDTLPNTWEQTFALNPLDPSDASLDPDGDGRTNAQEFEQHSHPKSLASATRYFAEGATSSFFETRISIANPGTVPATALLRYVKPDGSLASTVVPVPAQQSRKVTVSAEPGMATAEFATVVESDQPVVADRLLWWNAGTAYGTHAERAVTAPTARWYLAEGATHSGFDLFYLLQNPGATNAQVRVRYLLPNGAPLEKDYTVPAGSRFNIWVNTEELPAASGSHPLASTDVSADIEVLSGPAIVVERAMYLTRSSTAPGGLFEAGHESAGVTSPSESWYFAEGATGDLFDLFLLVANPAATAASVRATYLLPGGQTYAKTYSVAPNSRYNIWVDLETFDGVPGTPLANVNAVSAKLEVLNAVPIVAERAMWWPGPSANTWSEAHNSPGATETSTRWVVADGSVQDNPARTDTYYLIANPTDTPASVRVALLYADGTPSTSQTLDVPAQSRFSVDVRSTFPDAIGRGFGAIVESLGTGAPAIVVEWSIYNDALGRTWVGGANALGTPVPDGVNE